MKRIEINTAHNITINTTLATTMERALATVIDSVLIIFWFFLTSSLGESSYLLFALLFFPVFLFYHLLFEIYNNGQSIGKKLLRLKVVTEKGTTPSINTYFKRWTFRIIDITGSIGCIAILFIMSTAKKQRIGDVIAQTLVIKIKDQSKIELQQLENFYSTQKEFKYPQLVQYNDNDMLIVKESIERYKRYPNPNNRKLLKELSDRITHDLEIDSSSYNSPTQFLQSILEEYILQTR